MKRKINIQLIAIAVMAIAATVLLISTVYYNIFCEQVKDDLRLTANILKNTDIKEASGNIGEIRVTLISEDGTVLYDNDINADNMQNHSDRPEVKQAFLNGTGEAVRRSDTLNKNTFYYAVKLDDYSVLRVSRQAGNIINIFGKSVPVISGIIIIMIALCIILAHFFTRNLLRPIEKMTDDYTIVPEYKEMVPFMNTIREQHENILKNAKMRQDFTANVSHELKTPLTAISGYAELMENGMVSGDDIMRFSGEIVKNSDRLLSLINDIIRLSELDNMEDEITLEDMDLYEAACQCVYNLAIAAQKHGVKLRVAGHRLIIKANRDMIVELINNLCDNAIRYNDKNGWVKVSVYEEEEKIILSVKDNGIGISPEHQDRVFERFYRVDKSRSRQNGGTGLGLAIVKHIAHLHNADIELYSESGKGTEIRIIF